MVATGLLVALFVIPIALVFMMRRKLGTNDGIPAVRSTPNCDAGTKWCTCPNGESWQMQESQTCESCSQECYNRMGQVTEDLIPNDRFDFLGGSTGRKEFSNMVQGTLQFPLSEKVAIPIVEETYDINDSEFFDNFAHGACQCDDYECCYHAPYQSGRGDVRTETSCEGVFYGDQVQACDNAFLNWQDDMFDTGIDENNYIAHKVNDKRFFYELGYKKPRNRYNRSGSYMPTEYAYMATKAHRPYGQRAYSANINRPIRGIKKNSMRRILRERTAGKNLKYARAARKLL